MFMSIFVQMALHLDSQLKVLMKNNICAYLDTTSRNATKFIGMIEFLKRSRIYIAISRVCVPYLSHQHAFWSTT